MHPQAKCGRRFGKENGAKAVDCLRAKDYSYDVEDTIGSYTALLLRQQLLRYAGNAIYINNIAAEQTP